MRLAGISAQKSKLTEGSELRLCDSHNFLRISLVWGNADKKIRFQIS